MSKFFQEKQGKDVIGYATREDIDRLNKEYSGLDIPYNAIIVCRDNTPYAVIYWHKCRRYTCFLFRPLVYETMKRLAQILQDPKKIHECIKAASRRADGMERVE